MKIIYPLVLVLFVSCTKEMVYEPVSLAPAVVAKAINDTITNVQIFNYDTSNNTTDINWSYSYSANGTVYYDNNIIIAPGTQHYMSPIHLIKKNNQWALEGASYGGIIDRARNTYKVTDGTYVWANAGTESETNPTGNLYVSKTNPDKSLTWKRLSRKDKEEFYHYAATGDIDGDGNSDILSYVGAETESPELFQLYTGPNYNNVNVTFPTAKEFETFLGFTDTDRTYVKAGFSFGSITVADLDLETPGNELVLTSTKAKMNKYYSFILLNYDKNAHKFYINKKIGPGGLLLDKNMGVADIKFGNFDGNDFKDVVVTMGNHETGEYTGIQVWTNDGHGNLTPHPKKQELYCAANNNIIYFSNFEVGKFRGKDCIFLHYEGSRYVPKKETDLDLTPFILMNTDNDGPFKYSVNVVLKQAPAYVKGYFEYDALRLIGVKGIKRTEFELTDMTIR